MQKTRLIFDLRRAPAGDEELAGCAQADGLVLGAGVDPAAVPLSANGWLALCGRDPETAIEQCNGREMLLVQDAGLEQLARCRDQWPELHWLPRAQVYRTPARFDFQPEFHGEGFKVYMPNLATYRTYRVARDELELRAWLARACALGFARVWLAGTDAEAAGKGLDLEMLDAARRDHTGKLWISGGATTSAHLRNLARGGGADAVVLPFELALAEGARGLRDALAPALPVTTGTAPNAPACGGATPCA